MMRILFSATLAIHGIIHLIGFSKQWNLVPNGAFSEKSLIPIDGNISKFVGILWLITCILLVVASIAYYLQKEWFVIPASVGLILSETLIIIYWQDAKWGTVINILILIVVVLSAAKSNFNKMVKKEVAQMVSAASGEQEIITQDIITKLPPIIQTWLSKSHIIGKEIPSSIHVVQKGWMRTDPTSKWMPFDADQYFTIEPPAFVWNASIHTGAFIDITGRDKYENGRGNMLIKASSLIPIANSTGKEVDEGTMIRFMAEMMWFPHAVVSEHLYWEQLGQHHARVTMHYGEATASGVYTFNEDGFPTTFEAQRYREEKGTYQIEKWSVAVKGYQNFDGMTIGNKCEVTWKLKDGDFTWLKLEVIAIHQY